MTSPMALPAPVARLVRATAGRRALQLALLFGGLFVLGIVCGGRAQADGLSDAGSLGSGHVAVREHVADSVGKLREAGSREATVPSKASEATETTKDTGASTHAKPAAPTQDRKAAPAAHPAPAPAPVRPAEPTPNPVDAQHAPDANADHASGVKRLARPLHEKPAAPTAPAAPAAPGDPSTRTTTSTSTTRTLTAPVRAYLAEPLRQHIEALGGGQVRLRSAVDALRYLTAPVGATVRQVTGPVEELATRAVAELVGAVPEQLTHGRLGGIIRIVDPADARPAPPAATAPQQSDTPAVHGDRPATAEGRSHAAVSGPQAYDVARFGDVQKAEAGTTQAEARPASPVVPQRPDGVPSAGASAGDGGSTRHGDLHAATFGGRAPVLLASGATASAGTEPVVDRLRDIPEFPG